MHEDFDFDGEAEMKTMKDVYDMLVLTGYKEEAETVRKAMKVIESYATAIDKAERAFNESLYEVKEITK